MSGRVHIRNYDDAVLAPQPAEAMLSGVSIPAVPPAAGLSALADRHEIELEVAGLPPGVGAAHGREHTSLHALDFGGHEINFTLMHGLA